MCLVLDWERGVMSGGWMTKREGAGGRAREGAAYGGRRVGGSLSCRRTGVWPGCWRPELVNLYMASQPIYGKLVRGTRA